MKGKNRKIALFTTLALLVGAAAVTAVFILRDKDFSFQDLKREDIKEIAFNTREDFYAVLDKKETDVIYEKLQGIIWEGSGAEDVALQGGERLRLTLKNGKEISFQGGGHTLIMENKAYYIEGNAIEDIDNLCNVWWEALREENEKRTDFSDLGEETVRDIKVYEGDSLCYELSEEEENEVLTVLHSMELEDGQETAARSTKKRYQIEKEDGIVVEFSVDESELFMHGRVFSLPEKYGSDLKKKQEKWIKEVCEKTRRMPFSDFRADTVKSIVVNSPSQSDARELTEEEKKELLDLLCSISVVGKGTGDYIGREGLVTEAFLIEKEDGTRTAISANKDPFIIDGKGYVIEDAELADRLAEMYRKYTGGDT